MKHYSYKFIPESYQSTIMAMTIDYYKRQRKAKFGPVQVFCLKVLNFGEQELSQILRNLFSAESLHQVLTPPQLTLVELSSFRIS